jgi:hypothetical protein
VKPSLIALAVAVLLVAGCGGGSSVEQKFSDKIGRDVTGCEKKLSNAERTLYQCDNGILGMIKADGTAHVLSVTSSSG